MKRKVIILIAVVLSTLPIFSQNNGQTIRGTVVDAFTGSPVIGANVIISESNPLIGTSTDANGEFEIKNIQPGRWSFSASILGYKSQSFSNVMVISGKETTLSFKLEEKVTTLGDVVVKASHSKVKPINEMALISTRSFSVEETERFAGSLGDPARMVANFAGVVVGNDARNDIVIRGNSPMGLLWRIEGVDVPNPNHFGAQGTTGGPVSMLNNNLLANSDFMTSAFPSEYGNAMSGVFDLNLRNGNKEKFEFTGQVGFNGFEAAIEGPIKLGKFIRNGSFILDYRYSTMDLVSKMGMDMGTGTAIPEYQDLSVIVDLPTSKIGRFKFVGLFGKSFISMGRNFNIDETTSHNQIGYATDFGAGLNVSLLTHTLMLSEKTKLKTSISYQNSSSTTQNDTIDYANESFFENYAGKLNEDKMTASMQLKHKFSARNNMTMGFSANKFITTFNDSAWVKKWMQRVTLTDVDNEPSTLYKAHVNWQHKFTDVLTLNSGLHYQLYDLNNESALEPRLGLQWQATDNQTFSLGYGLHSQIQPRTVYFDKDYNELTGVYTENNHNVKFTRSNHYVLGYDWNIAKNFRIKSEAYYQGIYNAPISKSDGSFSMLNAGSGYFIAEPDSLQNTGRGRNYGLELTIEKFLSDGYYALMTVSLYDSKYKGYDNTWRNTAFNSNFAINFLAGYEIKVGKKNYLTFDTRTVLSGGMRYIPIDLAASVAKQEQVYDNSHIYTDKYKSYFRIDFRIGFKQNWGKISQEWGLDLQNITSHKNLYSEQYNNQLKEITTIYQQGFMPMMLYRINF
jgi:hypothetical protein